MKFKTFTFFVAPSLLMMLVFIAFPLVSVFVQSFFVTRPHFETVEVETCSPGFLKQTTSICYAFHVLSGRYPP